MLFKYHLTRFACCTLNCACKWPPDISWQACEDTDLLNTWHFAALCKCMIKWEKGNCSLTTTSARTSLKCRWISSRNACSHSFFPPFLYLTVKAALLLLTPKLVTCPPPVAHVRQGGSAGQTCCFSHCRQWVAGFLLWSIVMKCCKPQHIM